MPLGSFQGSTYDEMSFALHAGDLFVICTDGVFEAMDGHGQEFTAARLHRGRCQRSAISRRRESLRHLRGRRRTGAATRRRMTT